MKISVITGCYNAAETIEETLVSVFSQEGADLEYIVVDGASTDNTMEIIGRYRRDIALVISEPDKGMYDALNKGLANAHGDVIAFLHADDVFASNDVLSRVAEGFQRFGTDTLYGDLKYVDRNDLTRTIRHWESGAYNRNSWRRGWMPPHPAFFARRECYDQWGGFNLDFTSAADYELMLRFLYKHSAGSAHIPLDCVLMRVGGKSNASLRNRLHANREDVRAWRANGLNPPLGLALMKPLRKVGQFFRSNK